VKRRRLDDQSAVTMARARAREITREHNLVAQRLEPFLEDLVDPDEMELQSMVEAENKRKLIERTLAPFYGDEEEEEEVEMRGAKKFKSGAACPLLGSPHHHFGLVLNLS